MRLVILLVCMLGIASGYEVLLALPLATKHLNNVFCGIAKGLVNNGHKVTIFSPYAPNFSHENVTIVKLVVPRVLLKDFNQFQSNSSSLIEHATETMWVTAKAMWEGFKIKELEDVKDKFHAVVTPAFLNEFAYTFLRDYSGVYATVYSQGIEHFVVARALAEHHAVNPSLDDPYFDDYAFLDKLLYSFKSLSRSGVEQSPVFPSAESILLRYEYELGNLNEYRARSRLTLVDGHQALDGPATLVPGQVEIGTIAARTAQPPSQEMEQALRTTKGEGIIYVSFGSHMKSGHMPQQLKDTLLAAFSQLPYKVLWQYDGMDLDRPPNLLVRKHFPQQDILGHPQTKVFISHCSLPAVQEAGYHGVPVLALPIAFDQHHNAKKLVQRGLAISMDWQSLTPEAIVEAVATLTQTYSARMRDISMALKDQKESAGERAAWWLEYSIRHQGAPLLHPSTAGHAVRAYCDAELLEAWAAITFTVGCVTGLLVTLLFVGLWWCCLQVTGKHKYE